MADSSQVQKAGAGASQLQVGVLNVGIDEKRVREICDEKIAYAIQDLTIDAKGLAEERIVELVGKMLAKIQERKVDMSSFADPKFQRELIKAQSSAAASDRKSDIEMLSELLVARMDGTLQRKMHTGISRAIEIVSDIDDDELAALTVVYAFANFRPVPILGVELNKGLKALEDVYERIDIRALPKGDGWMENLIMLDAIILNQVGTFKKMVDYYAELMDGYVCAGIEENSPNFSKAQQLLRNANLPLDILVRNELLPDHVRLPFVKQVECAELPLFLNVSGSVDGNQIQVPIKPTDVQINAMKEVLALYKKDSQLMKCVKDAFKTEWQKYPSLVAVQKWMGGLKKSFDITKVGRALAYTNARRCAPGLPALNLEEL